MNISLLKYNSPLPFTSKKKEVKSADNILRKTALELPSFSTSYCAYNYRCCRSKSSNLERAIVLKSLIAERLQNKRDDVQVQIRKNSTDGAPSMKNEVLAVMDGISKSKLGNCYESSITALGALYANGYYNSNLTNLYFVSEIVDIRTNEVVESFSRRVDHVFVTSDMNNKNAKQEIVIDPWLGFAGSKESALGLYKKVFNINADADYRAWEHIKEKEGESFDMRNYRVRGKFVFKNERPDISDEEKREISEGVKKDFSELVIKKEI